MCYEWRSHSSIVYAQSILDAIVHHKMSTQHYVRQRRTMWYNTLMDHDQIQTVLHKVLGDDLKNDVSLRDYTTMRVGGASDFFYEAKVIDNLILALRACFEHDIPYIVLGSGSNVIFSDAGFPGLVVHNMTSNVSFIPEKSQVIVDSGTIYARLITEAASRGFGGIEYWFGLPGTIGGAVHNNAETWGHDMGEVVKQVTMMLPPADGKPERIEQVGIEWMQYRYRGSRLFGFWLCLCAYGLYARFR